MTFNPSGNFVIPTYLNSITVTAIGSSAFANQILVTSITVPSSVTSIGNGAFSDCTSLETVFIERASFQGITTLGLNAFASCSSLIDIYVPGSSSVTAYKSATNWSNYSNLIRPLYDVTISDSHTYPDGSGYYTQGTKVYIYAGTQSGYTFNGWTSSDVTITNASSASGAYFTMPNKAVTVEANWVPTPYKVTVNLDGGSSSNSGAGSYTANSMVYLNAGTKSGYNFSHWTIDQSNVTIYNSSSSNSAYFCMPSKAVIVTAHWTQITYVVTVNLNGGSSSNSGAGSYPAGTKVNINAGTQSGYTFDGWTVTSGGQNSMLNSASSSSTYFNMPSNAVTVSANWTPVSTTYSVAVNDSYANLSGADDYPSGSTVYIHAGTRYGYIFDGWVVDYGNVSLGSTASAATSFTMPANAVSVTAIWSQIPDWAIYGDSLLYPYYAGCEYRVPYELYVYGNGYGDSYLCYAYFEDFFAAEYFIGQCYSPIYLGTWINPNTGLQHDLDYYVYYEIEHTNDGGETWYHYWKK